VQQSLPQASWLPSARTHRALARLAATAVRIAIIIGVAIGSSLRLRLLCPSGVQQLIPQAAQHHVGPLWEEQHAAAAAVSAHSRIPYAPQAIAGHLVLLARLPQASQRPSTDALARA